VGSANIVLYDNVVQLSLEIIRLQETKYKSSEQTTFYDLSEASSTNQMLPRVHQLD
jgi:hypothetical protein